MSEFPIEYEVIITYTDKNGEVKKYNEKSNDLGYCMKTVRHFRPSYGEEILKYEINVQRVLF